MTEHMTLEDKTFELKEFVHAVYNCALPPHTSDIDVNALWEARRRIVIFKDMADNAETQRDYDLFLAIHEDYKMFFYAVLYAISSHSDKLSEARQQLMEKNAQRYGGDSALAS